MMTGNRTGAGTQEKMMNQEFDRWLRDSLPEPREDVVEARTNLAIIRDRLGGRATRRRNITGLLAVAVPALAVFFFAGGVVELGSDDFSVEETVLPDSSDPVLIRKVENLGINVPSADSRAETEEIILQQAADESQVRRVEGWMINGKTHWVLTRAYHVDGQEMVVHEDVREPATELTLEIARFIMSDWDDFKPQIMSGSIAPVGKHTVALDGVVFTVKAYALEAEDAGEVTYYLGEPTP